MNMVLNQSNLVLVNRMRIAAQRESSELDILRFFADLDYARSRLLAFVATGKPELAALARRTASTVLASDAPAQAPAAAAAAAEPAAALAAVAPAVHQASTAPAQHHLPTAPALHPGLVAPAVGATTPRRTAPAVAPAATPAGRSRIVSPSTPPPSAQPQPPRLVVSHPTRAFAAATSSCTGPRACRRNIEIGRAHV